MKKVICPVLALAAILFISCTNSNSKKAANENPYIGAWELISMKWVLPDTTYQNTQFTNPNVKLLTKKHYAFGNQTAKNEVFAGGGEYTYDGDTFTSLPKYHSNKGMVGNKVVWKSKIDGDLWSLSHVSKNDTIQYETIETWKRIIE